MRAAGISQSAKNPWAVRFVEENDAPIERSGTATITFLRPWLYNLSKPTNINARDLPDAGGALINKC